MRRGEKMSANKVSVSKAAKMVGVSRATFYRVLSQSLTEFKKPCNAPNSRRSPGGKIALLVLSFDRCIW